MRPTSTPARLARYGFADPTRAAMLLASPELGLWDEAGQRPADGGGAEVLDALAGAADPDLALRQLHRLAEASVRAGLALDLRDCRRLIAVLGASATLGDHLVANPAEAAALSTSDGWPPVSDVASLRVDRKSVV